MMKTLYFIDAAQSLGESVKEYLGKAKYNYVIIEGDKPVMWRRSDSPVIFGDLGEVARELANWTLPIENISIITEEDYIKRYLGNAWKEWYEYEETIMDTGNGHSEELVNSINHAWRKNREMFCGILCALYKRDIDEITDADSFQSKEWSETEEYQKGLDTGDWQDFMDMVLDKMCEEWDFYAENYLMHVADDCDLECILRYLHYPYLPIYKD